MYIAPDGNFSEFLRKLRVSDSKTNDERERVNPVWRLEYEFLQENVKLNEVKNLLHVYKCNAM
jgi:hypothetical protein